MRRTKFRQRLGTLTLLVSLSLILMATGSWADSITYYPVADSQVDSVSAGNNGTLSSFGVAVYSDTWLQRSYLKFDLGSGIPAGETITGATLYIESYFTAVSGNPWVNLYPVADTSWVDRYPGYITWATAPPMDTGNLLDSTLVSALDTWYSWDVPATALTQGLVSFGLTLQSEEMPSHYAYFYSREYKDGIDFYPYLVVTTAPVPIPGAVWLLGSGLLGLVGLRRLRKK
jgi:hypothetical protein